MTVSFCIIDPCVYIEVMDEKEQTVIYSKEIKEFAKKLGAVTVGITRTEKVEREDQFLEWLNRGYSADMDYLKRYRKERFDPAELLPGAKSIIVIGVNHFTPTSKETPNTPFKVARFAQGEDYHRVLRKMLKKIRTFLRQKDESLRGRICVDTAPFMDKYWAERAGLGWQGKHTNLISRKYGNWLSLGSLIINADCNYYDPQGKDYCGTCTRCLEACPTGALVEPYVLDSNLCISYWTVESKAEKIPDQIASKLNGYVFGCDICLEICPFNRGQRPTEIEDLKRDKNVELIEEGKAGKLNEKQFEDKYSRSMVNRRGLFGIKRNLKAARANSNSNKERSSDEK